MSAHLTTALAMAALGIPIQVYEPVWNPLEPTTTISPDDVGILHMRLAGHPELGIAAPWNGKPPAEVRTGAAIPRPQPVRDGLVVQAPKEGWPADRILAGLAQLSYRVRQKGRREWRARCPHHGGHSTTSLSVREYPDGHASVHCFGACRPWQVLRHLGLTPPDLFPIEEPPEVRPVGGGASDPEPKPAVTGHSPLPPHMDVISLAELVRLDLPEVRWAVPGLIPEGLTILASRPKLGKSWMALGLAIAVASGGRALGNIEVEQGDVLYLAMEDSRKRLQGRALAVLQGSPAPTRVDIRTTWPRVDQGGVEEIERWLEGHREARLVLIDTLKKLRGQLRGRGSAYDDDYEFLEPLQELAIRKEVAIVVLHHDRKLIAEDWIDCISGTLGLAGAADGLMGLFRARGERNGTLKVTGRDQDEQELAVSFDPATGCWAVLGDAAEIRISEERKEIQELLKDTPPLGPREIARRLVKNENTVKRLVRMMADAGQLTSAGGLYTVKGGTHEPNELREPARVHDPQGSQGSQGSQVLSPTVEEELF